jgi:glycerophosphoryl diester phosphodiesterase
MSVISEVKKRRPDLPAYFLHNPEKISAKELVAEAKTIHADGVDLKACKELNAAYARKIHDAGLRLDVWTVNDPAEARRMIKLGVQGITTDRPQFLREQAIK